MNGQLASVPPETLRARRQCACNSRAPWPRGTPTGPRAAYVHLRSLPPSPPAPIPESTTHGRRSQTPVMRPVTNLAGLWDVDMRHAYLQGEPTLAEGHAMLCTPTSSRRFTPGPSSMPNAALGGHPSSPRRRLRRRLRRLLRRLLRALPRRLSRGLHNTLLRRLLSWTKRGCKLLRS